MVNHFSARHGDSTAVLRLLDECREGRVSVDINCRGQNKANLGWTPLHLATYFGHTDVVTILLEVLLGPSHLVNIRIMYGLRTCPMFKCSPSIFYGTVTTVFWRLTTGNFVYI